MADGESTGMSMGLILGLLIVILFVVLYFVLGQRGFGGTTDGGAGGGVTVPDQIDINVNPNGGE
jgi:hypothetical protein